VDIGKEIAKVQSNLAIGKVDKLLASLNAKDSSSLVSAMNDLSISSRTISKVLKGRGYVIGRRAVDNWRHSNVPNYETRSNHYIGGN
jgi:hypothetical protein